MSKKEYGIFFLSLMAVLLGTAAIYWRGLAGPYLLDDFQNIVSSYVNDFNWDDIYYVITHNKSGELGRPISMLSIIFSGIVHGPIPWGYKFHNLAIHLINGLLIFWLLIRILPRLSVDYPKEKILFIAGMTATLWLLHPLLVSTVLYSVQRMAQLSVLFTLASLVTYVSAREMSGIFNLATSVKFYITAYFLFPMFLLLSMFSKENGALIPVYVLIIEFIVFRFRFDSSVQRNRLWTFLGFFVVIPLLLGSFYVLTHLDQLSNFSQRNFNMFERVLTQVHVVAIYLKMILLPRLSDMTLFHDYIEITTGFDLVTTLLLLIFLAGFILIFYLREKAPVVSFAIAWFFVSHLMESTIFNLELMFEHRNYLAAAGPLLAVVYYLCNSASYPKLKYANFVLVLLLGFLTATRVGVWQSSELIYQVAYMEHPESQRSLTVMANMHYRNGNLDEAVSLLQEIQKNNPEEFGAFAHEAAYNCGTGINNDELFDQAEEKASLYPITPYSFSVLEMALVALRNSSDCNEISAERVLKLVQAAKSQENNKSNEQYIGYLENIEGQLYLLTGETGKGIQTIWSAYTKTGLTVILSQLTENLLILNLIGDAEVIVSELEKINNESRGTETALLKPLQEKLAIAKSRLLPVGSESPQYENNENTEKESESGEGV